MATMDQSPGSTLNHFAVLSGKEIVLPKGALRWLRLQHEQQKRCPRVLLEEIDPTVGAALRGTDQEPAAQAVAGEGRRLQAHPAGIAAGSGASASQS